MKPILFNTEMVKSIQNNTKKVTRRVIKPKYTNTEIILQNGKVFETAGTPSTTAAIKLPYQVGDILYVRETWAELETVYGDLYYAYKADDDILHHSIGENFTHWGPSIHMPKEAARIFLRVTDVKVERLQEIMEDPPGKNNQIIREGFAYGCDFIAFWNNTINKSDIDKYGWNANPWVWVIEFERIGGSLWKENTTRSMKKQQESQRK